MDYLLDATFDRDRLRDLEMVNHCVHEILADLLPATLAVVVALPRAFSWSKEYLSLGDFDMGRPKA
jgi:hypothetical protein